MHGGNFDFRFPHADILSEVHWGGWQSVFQSNQYSLGKWNVIIRLLVPNTYTWSQWDIDDGLFGTKIHMMHNRMTKLLPQRIGVTTVFCIEFRNIPPFANFLFIPKTSVICLAPQLSFTHVFDPFLTGSPSIYTSGVHPTWKKENHRSTSFWWCEYRPGYQKLSIREFIIGFIFCWTFKVFIPTSLMNLLKDISLISSLKIHKYTYRSLN